MHALTSIFNIFTIMNWLILVTCGMCTFITASEAPKVQMPRWNKAPKVQMPRCSNMCASMQLADAYDSTYSCSRAMEAVSWKHQNSIMEACKQ